MSFDNDNWQSLLAHDLLYKNSPLESDADLRGGPPLPPRILGGGPPPLIPIPPPFPPLPPPLKGCPRMGMAPPLGPPLEYPPPPRSPLGLPYPPPLNGGPSRLTVATP